MVVVYTLGLTVSYDTDLINLRLLVKRLEGWEYILTCHTVIGSPHRMIIIGYSSCTHAVFDMIGCREGVRHDMHVITS